MLHESSHYGAQVDGNDAQEGQGRAEETTRYRMIMNRNTAAIMAISHFIYADFFMIGADRAFDIYVLYLSASWSTDVTR